MASLMDAPDVLKKIAAYKTDEVAALNLCPDRWSGISRQ